MLPLPCDVRDVRQHLMRTVALARFPEIAEGDVIAAINQVPGQSQALLTECAADAVLPFELALVRLSCLWSWAAAVNLADDLADGDCDYLAGRVAPGVCFLLQSLAGSLAAQSELTLTCQRVALRALARAAAGQSLEVRAQAWNKELYLDVAGLIAGEQYSAYLQMLWDGTPLGASAAQCGRDLGCVGLTLTDVESSDGRFFSMSPRDRECVLAHHHEAIVRLMAHPSRAVMRFAQMARASLARSLT
jgi:hypothetical protein